MKKSQNTDIGDFSDADILEHIMQMNPFKFEHFVGNLLNTMGFKTRVTKPTGDGGVDIEAEHETPTGASIEYVVQVKRHTNIISPKDLQALVGAMQGSKADRCIFITTSSFSTKSVEYAERMKTIELVDGKKLIELIREHGVMPETLAKIGESRISIPVCSADEAMKLGKEAYSRGDYEDALKYFDRVTNLEPENDEAWVWKGKSDINKLRFSGFPSKELLKRLSTKQYEGKLWEWGSYIGWKITPEQEKRHGKKNPEQKKWYEYFEKAIEINPDNIEAWSYVNPEKAIELCEKRLESNPNDEQAWLTMGRAYTMMWNLMRGRDYIMPGEAEEKAQECFNKVVELNPKNEEALFNIGISYVSQSRNLLHYTNDASNARKAFSYFERCSEINPDNHYYTDLVEAIKVVTKTEEREEEVEKLSEQSSKEKEEQPKERTMLQEFDERPVWQKVGILFSIIFLFVFLLGWGITGNIVIGICSGIFLVVGIIFLVIALSASTPL